MSALNIDNLPKNRQFTAIVCDDERGRNEFTGSSRVRDAAAYTPKGSDVQWWVRRENGILSPVRQGADVQDATNRVASEPQPLPTAIAPPSIDSLRLALEYGDRNSQLIARAYADAYKVAGTSWAAVVQPLAQALSALSSRVVTLESRLEELPVYEATATAEPEPPQRTPLDDLAEGVLAGVVQGAMNGTPPKP